MYWHFIVAKFILYGRSFIIIILCDPQIAKIALDFILNSPFTNVSDVAF